MRRGGAVEEVRRRRGGEGGGGGGGRGVAAPRGGEGHGVWRGRRGAEGHGRGTQRRGEDGRAGGRAEVRRRVARPGAWAGGAPRGEGGREDARRRGEGRRGEGRRRVRRLRLQPLPRRRLLHAERRGRAAGDRWRRADLEGGEGGGPRGARLGSENWGDPDDECDEERWEMGCGDRICPLARVNRIEWNRRHCGWISARYWSGFAGSLVYE